jgi:UDP:flavonoid glycosyltransferase YjiC (YdhE family)
VDDAELTGGRLIAEIESLLDDDARRARMRAALASWAKADAALEAADRIVELVKKNGTQEFEAPQRSARRYRAGMTPAGEGL